MPESRKKIAARKGRVTRPVLRVIQNPNSTSSATRIRWSKVMTAQTRVAEGYYDREDVRTQLLTEVLEELLSG
jgi:hypothetical protein